MATLYNISENLASLEKLLEEAGGDVTEGGSGEMLEQWMQEYEWQEQAKVDAYGGLIRNYESDIESIQVEMKRLSDRARVIANRIDSMKRMAKLAMDLRGVKKIQGKLFTISVQKNGGAQPVEILVQSADMIPDQWVKIMRQADKDKIREALEKNDPEAARIARLCERGESVRIK